MKDTVLDVLMYLFENPLSDLEATGHDEAALRTMLLEAGFPGDEVSRALEWLGTFHEEDVRPVADSPAQKTLRVLSREETAVLGIEAQGLLLYLRQARILDDQSFELVLDRVMELPDDEIDTEQIKMIILLALFSHPSIEPEKIAGLAEIFGSPNLH